LLAAALCAAFLIACGGDGDDDPTTATSANGAGVETTDGAATDTSTGDDEGTAGDGGSTGSGSEGGSGSGDSDSSGDDGGSGSGDGGSASGSGGNGGGNGRLGGPASLGPTKNPVPGLEDERSGTFSTPGGDNSIQEYGEEEGAEGRREATTVLIALFNAIESGNWSEVCSKYLSSANLQQIKLLAQKAPQAKGKDCPEILSGFTQRVPGRSPDSLRDSVASFRTDGDVGFAIWLGLDGKGYAMPMKLEDSGWKLTALAPTPLQF
jgi:hypothetical protein